MAFRNDLVQVGHALLLGRQQNDVVRIADGAARQRGIDFVQPGDALLSGRVEHAVEHVRRRARVMHGSVCVFEADAQRFADRAEPVALEAWVHPAGKFQRVDHRHVDFNAQPVTFLRQEGIIEFRVVRRERRPADEFQQLRNFDLRRARVSHHRVGDVRQLGNLLRNRLHRIDEPAVFLHHLSVADAHRADLHNAAFARVEPRGFKVHHDDIIRQRPVVAVLDHDGHIRQIALHARNELDLVLFRRAEGLRERLHHAMIRDGDGRVSPLRRALNQVAGRGNRVHLAHVGVHVQLDALALGRVLTHGLLPPVDVVDHHHQAVLEAVHLHIAANGEPFALLDGGNHVVNRLLFFLRRRAVVLLLRSAAKAPLSGLIAQKRLALDGVRIIRQREGEKLHFAAAQLARLHRQHLAADRQLAGFLRQFADGQRFGGDRPPEDGLRLFLGGLGLLRGDLLALRLNHLCDGLLVLGLAAAANLLQLLLAQLHRLKDDMHLRHEHILDQMLDVMIHAGLCEEFRRDVLRHKHAEHIALTFQLCVVHKRRAGGMAALDAAQNERRILLRVIQKILRELRRADDQLHPRRRKIAPDGALRRQKRLFLHQHIRREKDRNLVARLAGRHALQGQMPLQLLRRAFEQAFPLLCHCTSPTPSVSFADSSLKEGAGSQSENFQIHPFKCASHTKSLPLRGRLDY